MNVTPTETLGPVAGNAATPAYPAGSRMGAYRIESVVSRQADRAVLRARRIEADGTPGAFYCLRVFERSLTDLAEAERVERDFRIARDLAGPGVAPPAEVGSSDGVLFLVYAAAHRESLADRLLSLPLTPEEAIALALGVTGTLARVHGSRRVHRNINPETILLKPGGVDLVGFGHASESEREAAAAQPPHAIADDLGCVAPEQTGRLERSIDFRADFYALGAVLYEAVTGLPPFVFADAAEAIYAHLALDAEPPTVRRSAVPEHFSQLILKLLEKEPEARYQSHRGLIADLTTCAERLAGGRTDAFELGRLDRPERLLVSGRSYGRGAEQRRIAALCRDAIAGQGGVVLVGGVAGIGKTDLVQTVRREILTGQARFSAVKLDRDEQRHAFAAVRTAAAERLAELAGDAAALAHVAHMAGDVLPALTAMLPEIGTLFPALSPAPVLPPQESKNRLVRAFTKLLPALARSGNGWVLFLDDLQWVDHGSIQVLHQLAEMRRLGHLSVLGAYRSDEVGHDHPLAPMLDGVAAETLIALQPLTAADVHAFVVDTLGVDDAQADAFAAFCHSLTRGNPFHLRRLVAHLDKTGAFENTPAGWRWRAESVADLPGDIASLLLADAARLDPAEQDVLKVASCLGEDFTLADLAVATGIGEDMARASLSLLIDAGLLRPGMHARAFTFVHDRVREAAETLLDGDTRDRLRLAIGRRLAAASGDALPGFAELDHLNAGRRFITDAAERAWLAAANRHAAGAAAATCAFELATTYACAAVDLSDAADDGALDVPFLAFAARMAIIATRAADAERLLALADIAAATTAEHARIAEVRIEACYAEDRLSDAVDLGIATLTALGVDLPRPADLKDLADMVAALRDTIRTVGVTTALAMDEMADPQDTFELTLAAKITAAAYIARPNLLPILTLYQCRRMIAGGPVAAAMSAYAVLGLMMAEFLGDYQAGYELGRAADAEVRRRGWRPVEAHVGFSYNTFLRHWCEPLVNTLDGTMRAHVNGVEHGNHRHAGLALHLNGYHAFLMGEPLPDVAARIDGYIATLKRIRQPVPVHYLSTFRQAIDDLAGPDPCAVRPLDGTIFARGAMEAAHIARGDMTGLLFLHAVDTLLASWAEDWPRALSAGDAAAGYFSAGRGMVIIPVTLFHQTVARLALAAHAPEAERAALMEAARPVLARFAGWATFSPNLGWRSDLLHALAALAAGETEAAIARARTAVTEAAQARCWPEVAFANRWLARALLAAGDPAGARRAFAEARLHLVRWGAPGLARTVEDEMRGLVGAAPTAAPDAATLVKIAQVMSDDLNLDALISRLLLLLRETAGARTACLVLDSPDGGWRIAGRLAAGSATVEHDSLPLSASDPTLAAAALQEALTRGTSLQCDATADRVLWPGRLTHGGASALCLPLTRHGKTVGALYLENDRVAGLFPAERVEFLELVSGQIVNAIENARLYGTLSTLTDELEASVAERTRQLGASEARIRSVLVSLPIPTFVSRLSDGQILFVNPRGAALFGLTIEETMRQSARNWYADPADRDRMVEMIGRRGRFTDLELRFRDRRGGTRWVMMSGEAFEYDGETALLATMIDISERRRKDEELRHHAERDGLTGLFNRRTFAERVEARLAAAQAAGTPLALLYLDIDRFKWINDRFGHAAGDTLLRTFSERLVAWAPKDAIISRLGGDEFVVVCAADPETALAMAARLNASARQPLMLSGQTHAATITIGIACPPSPGDTLDSFLKKADLALYRAKLAGRDTARLFDDGAQTEEEARALMERELRGALERGELRLDYQPIVTLATGATTAVEALLRWCHPTLGAVSPAEFIPVAESSGLIVPLGAWVIDRACRDAASLPAHVGMSINISPAQLRSDTLVEAVRAALATAHLAASRLTLEVTETVFLTETPETRANIEALRTLGVRLAIDDFGVGYSSLGYLRRFPFDQIKIDRSFVADVVGDRNAALIVAAIANLAQGLGMTLIAEGIETEEQLAAVRAAGCTEGQGYLFSAATDLSRLTWDGRQRMRA